MLDPAAAAAAAAASAAASAIERSKRSIVTETSRFYKRLLL